jgi:hypothetical protein
VFVTLSTEQHDTGVEMNDKCSYVLEGSIISKCLNALAESKELLLYLSRDLSKIGYFTKALEQVINMKT